MSTRNIFITGASGYIGGAVLHELLSAEDAAQFHITALVRNKSHGAALTALNVTPIYGGLDDADIITRAVTDADIIFNTADVDHVPSAKAIIAGLHSTNGGQRRRILIHTSGTSLIGDDARGEFVSEDVWSDLDTKRIFSLPHSAPHRPVDEVVISAAKAAPSVFDAYIICPPTIYGISGGPVNKLSQQIPGMIKAYIKRGKGGTVGAGLNMWNNVHIADLADLYVKVMRAAIKGGMITTLATEGGGGYYFCETGEHVLGDMSRAVAKILHDKKIIQTAEVDRLSEDEVKKYLSNGYFALGTNSRCSAQRAVKENVGWKPKYINQVFEQLPTQIDYIKQEMDKEEKK